MPGKGHEGHDDGGTKFEFVPIANKNPTFSPDLDDVPPEFDSSHCQSSSSSPFASSNMFQEANGNDNNISEVNLANRKKFKSTSARDLTSCKSESEGINNQGDGTGTGNATTVVLLNLNSLSPEESVFSIDHLLEATFGECDLQTLLNSRLVSRRWAHFGSKVLQKVVNIRFVQPLNTCMAPKSSNFLFKYDEAQCNIHDEDNHCVKEHGSLEHLITLMNNSTEFPSVSFSFSTIGGFKVTASAQAFLNAHGPSIKKLKFDGVSYLDDLKQILLVQAPNLEQLSLVNLNIMFKKSLKPSFESIEKRVKQKIYLFDIQQTLKIGTRPTLKKLKVFRCTAVIPETFIEQILEYSPNLVEVMLSQQSLHCLVRPINRLHLLKKLVIYVNHLTFESLKVVSHHHQNKLAVQEIHYLGYVGTKVEERDLYPHVKNIISRILNASSATCTRLVWMGSQGVENFQLILPQMPQVTNFIFEYNQDVNTGLPIRIFAKGVSFAESFPKLRSLLIDSAFDMTNLVIQNIFGHEHPAPAPNVRDVSLTFLPDKNLLQSFKKMFPNATIRTEVVLEVDEDYF